MKTVLITGANKGIGFETAKQMAHLGYFVYLGSRDKAKGLDAINLLFVLMHSNNVKRTYCCVMPFRTLWNSCMSRG